MSHHVASSFQGSHHLGLLLLPIALSLVSAAGCNSGLNLKDVTGTVTKDGMPLAEALVEFYPAGDAAPSYGKTDADGNFKLYYSTGPAGAFVGEHRVHIIGGHKRPAAPAPQPPLGENGETGEPVPVAAPDAPVAGGPAAHVLSAVITESGPNHIELKL